MLITELTLVNFRCFGPTPTKLSLLPVTALVGSNACGKTAALHALQRLFGARGSERDLTVDDFHVPRSTSSAAVAPATPRTLSIEARLEFPELSDPKGKLDAVAECFRQMVVTETGRTPFCLVRLEGTWTEGSLPEGVIEQHLYWVRAGAEGEAEKKHEMRATDRARIHVHYVPAARDPLRQVRNISGSMIAGLFKAVKWSQKVRDDVAKASSDIQSSFGSEPGVEAIQGALSENWQALHDALAYSGVNIRPISKRFEDILRQVEAVFSPSPGGEEDPLDRLSDGQRSLFYLTIVGAAFDIEGKILAAAYDEKAFDRGTLDPASLTVLLVEEPENHIAPHYLGRIMDVLRRISRSGRAEVVLTSHSPSIMHRVEPQEVRHLRLDPDTRTTLVRPIQLPPETDEAYKFIREAVRTYPELYFAKLVVLGEGDSEEIVVPRICEAHGLRIDQSFVSVVPLGGRHVNHLWRLLSSLDIPYLTLLDLDRERDGGGWGRVKYVLDQLLSIGTPRMPLLEVGDGKGATTELADQDRAMMHTWNPKSADTIDAWVRSFEKYGVFFSSPLDLDYTMLTAFPDAYCVVEPGARGPTIPQISDPKFTEQRLAVIRAVLKDAGGDGSTFAPDEIPRLCWYRYLFLGRGKPTTHLKALSLLSLDELKKYCPAVLSRLVGSVDTLLKGTPKDDFDGL